MKILALTGSPRKDGNTETVVKAIIAGAESKGTTVNYYDLSKLNISGCKACMYCKTNDGCAVKDDMLPLLEEVLTADAVILGSPVYMWQMTAQTKLFVDRLFALLNPDYTMKFKEGLPLVLVYTQGQPNINAFSGYFDMTAKMFEFLQFKVVNTLVCGNCRDKKDAEKNETVIAKAKEIGEYLTTIKR
ncbi:MAG: flavodoxin family protein [Desulfamplus sp.]|nr:flavodoxin family protein [Desulfamplus sp.]